jgi:hypothetical protein
MKKIKFFKYLNYEMEDEDERRKKMATFSTTRIDGGVEEIVLMMTSWLV